MKRLLNTLDAALPMPPSPTEFILAVRALATPPPAQGPDPVHGTMFSKAKKPSGSQGTERAGIKGFLDFASLCDKKQATYPSLDALFVAWGQWAIRPEALFVRGPQARSRPVSTGNRLCSKISLKPVMQNRPAPALKFGRAERTEFPPVFLHFWPAKKHNRFLRETGYA